MKNLNDSEDIITARENVKENTITSAKESLGLYELKQHKPWFDEGCLRLLDQRKEAKIQWLHDSNQSNTLIYTVQDVRLVDISGKKEAISEY